VDPRCSRTDRWACNPPADAHAVGLSHVHPAGQLFPAINLTTAAISDQAAIRGRPGRYTRRAQRPERRRRPTVRQEAPTTGPLCRCRPLRPAACAPRRAVPAINASTARAAAYVTFVERQAPPAAVKDVNR